MHVSNCSVLYFTVLLSWFVNKEVANDAIDDNLLIEEHVECKPERIPDSVLDENVDICLIHQYFFLVMHGCSWTLLSRLK